MTARERLEVTRGVDRVRLSNTIERVRAQVCRSPRRRPAQILALGATAGNRPVTGMLSRWAIADERDAYAESGTEGGRATLLSLVRRRSAGPNQHCAWSLGTARAVGVSLTIRLRNAIAPVVAGDA